MVKEILNIKILQKVRESLINALKSSTFVVGINFKLSKATTEPIFILESMKTSDFGTISQIKSTWIKFFGNKIDFIDINNPKSIKVKVLTLYKELEKENDKDTFRGKLISFLENELHRLGHPEGIKYFEAITTVNALKSNIVRIMFQSKKIFYQTIKIIEKDDYYSKRFIVNDDFSIRVEESRVKNFEDISSANNFFTKFEGIYSKDYGQLFIIETPATIFARELKEKDRAEIRLSFIRPDFLDKFHEISERIFQKWESDTIGLEKISIFVTEEEVKKFSSSFVGENTNEVKKFMLSKDNSNTIEENKLVESEEKIKKENVKKMGKNLTLIKRDDDVHPYETDRNVLMNIVDSAGYKVSKPKRGGSNSGIVGFSRVPAIIQKDIMKINILNNNKDVLMAVFDLTKKYFESRPEIKVEIDDVEIKVLIYFKSNNLNKTLKPKIAVGSIVPERKKRTISSETKTRMIQKEQSEKIEDTSVSNVSLDTAIDNESKILTQIDLLRKKSDENKIKFIGSISDKFIELLIEVLKEENVKIFRDQTVDAGMLNLQQLPLDFLSEIILLKLKDKLVI